MNWIPTAILAVGFWNALERQQICVHLFDSHSHGGAVRRGWRRTAAKGEKGDFDRLWAQCARDIGSHFVRATPR